MRLVLIGVLLVSSLWSQQIRAHKCGFAELGMDAPRSSDPASRDLDYLDESILSPDGAFRIHFTRTGTDAVTGANVPGTPAFVMEAAIAADSAYRVIVGKLGFQPPLPDAGVDGPELDIYIKNWGGAYYGMTYFGDTAPSSTYLVVDNDYIESSYATQGLDALRVTIAHEFFHMVQLRYAYPFDPVSSNAYWYEISSVWMEEKCYPDVNDYHAYVADNFRQVDFPALNDASFGFTYSYGHGLFGQILDREYGTRHGKHIMLDIWEHLSGREATDNLEQVLAADPWNSSLTAALGEYAIYNVFTGSRTIPGSYYPDAPELAEVNAHQYGLPLTLPISYDFVLAPFEISYRKFTIPTLSDYYISGTPLNSQQRVYLTFHSFDNGSSLKGAIGDFWTVCSNASSLDYLVLPLVNGNRDTTFQYRLNFEGNTLDLNNKIQSLWPNPNKLSIGPIQVNLMLAKPVTLELKVFDIRGRQVYQDQFFTPEGIRLIPLNLTENLPSGIYILRVRAGGTIMSRKFTVLK